MRKIVFDDEKILEEEVLINYLGRIHEMVYYNGDLYISTSNRDGRGLPRVNDDKIIRIRLQQG